MVHIIIMAVALALFWWVLSGLTLPLILAFGAGSIALVVWISHRMNVVDHETHPIHLSVKTLKYWAWLAVEIIKSNIAVAKIIVDPKLPIDPRLIRIKAGQKTELGQVVYANSITLTPGTVTVRLYSNGEMIIHAIDGPSAEGLETGDMDKKVLTMGDI